MKIEDLFLSKDLDEKLVKDFPNLYRERHTTNFGLRYGFKILVGWYDLVYNLSRKLEEEILKQPEAERERYHCLQVKQKFAGLRFYMAATTTEMDDMIQSAELSSYEVCEVCGKLGSNFWPLQPEPRDRIFTFCAEHKKEADRAGV